MVFNPLFFQVVNNQETPVVNKTQKLTGPSYLFSDIIKVCLDKTETGIAASGGETSADNNDLLSSILSTLSGSQSAKIQTTQLHNAGDLNPDQVLQMQSLSIPGLINLTENDLKGAKEEGSAEDANSLLVGNTELLNFINSLLANQQFNGKISIVQSETDTNGNAVSYKKLTDASSGEGLSANQLLDLLKNGNTLAVENSDSQSNNGLLVTLVQVADNAAANTQAANSQNANAQGGNAPLPEELYKLNLSMINSSAPEITLPEIQGPIIKLPFSNALNASKASKSIAETTGQSETGSEPAAVTKDIKTQSPASLLQPLDETKNTASSNELLAETKDPSGGDEISGKDKPLVNIEELSTKNVLVKENFVSEVDAKASKLSKIERVKTDPGIQIKETTAREIQNLEQLNDLGLKKGSLISDASVPEQNKAQKTDESTVTKTAEKQASKVPDNTPVLNQKENDLKSSSAGDNKQPSEGSADKTEVKSTSKSDMNNSSKEQANQKADGSLSAEHPETKAKPQEDHSFNINTLSKSADNFINVKRTAESGLFGEAEKTVKAAEVMKEISKFIQLGDRSSIVLKIDPENLGTVKIALDMSDKVVHANIEVENESARKLMENNLNQLYNSLNQNGVQLNSINISLSNSEQKQPKMQNLKRRTLMGESDKDSDDVNVLSQKQMGYNTYDYLI